jgi:orotidine-5'-phosphate decarboxylase
MTTKLNSALHEPRLSEISSSPYQNPYQKIIFALDFKSFEEAKPFIINLKDKVGLFKIGWTLLISEGLNVIERIQEITGASDKFFLDYKYRSAIDEAVDDIPEQVGGMASVLMSKSKGVEFITVHTSEGKEKVKDFVNRFHKGTTKVLGVTVLTSADKEDLKWQSEFSIRDLVYMRAEIAHSAGCHGVVCSGHEARAIKDRFGKGFVVVTPGIRPDWSVIKKDDQRRIMTPGDAIRNGADYIVVGRPISTAKDYVRAAEKIAQEIEAAMK